MDKPQYAILRFAKYKGPEIGHIEAHNERTKEKYASNPDVNTSRSHLNYHLVQPQQKYRNEAEQQIANAKCRIRKDSVRVVEALVTASPEFFKGKKKSEIRAFFEDALHFIEKHQSKDTIISTVVHMDEKTPHMHLSFVPMTADKRLSAKDIVGNKKKLTWWQDEFWKYMVKKYPSLERDMLLQLLSEINPLNSKKKSAEVEALLEQYIPGVEQMQTQLRKYDGAFKSLQAENADLKKKENDSRESVKYRLEVAQQLQELDELRRTVENIPPEIMQAYQQGATSKFKETER